MPMCTFSSCFSAMLLVSADASYSLGHKNSNTCPSGFSSIRGVDECIAAAATEGIQYARTLTRDGSGSSSHPIGCIVQQPEESTQLVFFNNHPVGGPSPVQVLLCKEISTEASTQQLTVTPTAAPTVQPTAEATAAPTPEPTSASTSEGTPQPTAEPTAAPSSSPTVAPTPQPTAAPTPDSLVNPDCTDDSSWFYKNDEAKTCEWVKANPKKCGKESRGLKVEDACPDACGKCCADDARWVYARKGKNRDCSWVAADSEKLVKRCNKKGKLNGERVSARDACKLTCGACGGSKRRLDILV